MDFDALLDAAGLRQQYVVERMRLYQQARKDPKAADPVIEHELAQWLVQKIRGPQKNPNQADTIIRKIEHAPEYKELSDQIKQQQKELDESAKKMTELEFLMSQKEKDLAARDASAKKVRSVEIQTMMTLAKAASDYYRASSPEEHAAFVHDVDTTFHPDVAKYIHELSLVPPGTPVAVHENLEIAILACWEQLASFAQRKLLSITQQGPATIKELRQQGAAVAAQWRQLENEYKALEDTVAGFFSLREKIAELEKNLCDDRKVGEGALLAPEDRHWRRDYARVMFAEQLPKIFAEQHTVKAQNKQLEQALDHAQSSLDNLQDKCKALDATITLQNQFVEQGEKNLHHEQQAHAHFMLGLLQQVCGVYDRLPKKRPDMISTPLTENFYKRLNATLGSNVTAMITAHPDKAATDDVLAAVHQSRAKILSFLNAEIHELGDAVVLGYEANAFRANDIVRQEQRMVAERKELNVRYHELSENYERLTEEHCKLKKEAQDLKTQLSTTMPELRSSYEARITDLEHQLALNAEQREELEKDYVKGLQAAEKREQNAHSTAKLYLQQREKEIKEERIVLKKRNDELTQRMHEFDAAQARGRALVKAVVGVLSERIKEYEAAYASYTRAAAPPTLLSSPESS